MDSTRNRGRVTFARGRLEGAGAALSFTDSEGVVSTFRVGESGRLQWWYEGRCRVKAVKRVVWGQDNVLSLVGGRGGTLFRASVTIPGPGEPLTEFKEALARLASAAAATVSADRDVPAMPIKHKARNKAADRYQIDVVLQSLAPPPLCATLARDWLSAPVSCMADSSLMAQLGQSIHGQGTQCSGYQQVIRWEELPPALNMTSDEFHTQSGSRSKDAQREAQRFERKQRQCDAFAAAMVALGLPDGTLVVDFGCGSCGLTLPLAWAFPRLSFVGVDLKPHSLELMSHRAKAAGMTNVRTVCRSISAFDEQFGLAVALHACGQASDDAVIQAVRNKAAYLVAPCCIGKLKFSYTTDAARQKAGKARRRYRAGPEQRRFGEQEQIGFINRLQLQGEGGWSRLDYPRSQWLEEALSEHHGAAGESPEEIYAGIAASADTNCHAGACDECDMLKEDENGSNEEYEHHRVCGVVVGMDRNMFAAEAGYKTQLATMPGCTTGKSMMLIGWLE